MLPELGHFTLILALLLAALQAFFGIAGPALRRERWMRAVIPATAGQAVLVATAFACLVASFVRHDFSLEYVAQNSNSALPLVYRVAAVWGAHEGSLVLWILLLAVWSVAVAIGTTRLPQAYASRVLGIMGVVSFGFLLFTLASSNPFARLIPAAPDGRDLNPLLQDPALALHPPLLYTGYVGFSVAFAFACAAMLEGRLDQAWARWTRPWTLAAWGFLSVGIALGSWWAYYELGWGGYWFWDPVENASFMPWLAGTALIHSLAVTEKRGLFKSWTLLLAILTFSLSLLGTFLVRSGVLVSVHSFAADPARGLFILAFLVVMIGGALALYAWRAPLLKSDAGFEIGSRESFLLFNNLLLVTATATVFGGTLAPLISDTLGLGTLSVGRQYFDPTFMLAMLPLIALACVGIHAHWKRGQLARRRRALAITGALGFLFSIALAVGVYGGRGILTLLGFGLGSWLILSSFIEPVERWRGGYKLSRSLVGMTLSHIAIGVLVVSITAVESFTAEQDFAVGIGETVQLGGYDFRFEGVNPIQGPNYDGVHGVINVTRDGRPVATLQPEKRRYYVQQSVMTEAGIATRAGSDLFVAIGEDLGAGRWSLRVQIRPLINWVWLSAGLMALGAVFSISDRRYRQRKVAAEVPDLGGAAASGGPAS